MQKNDKEIRMLAEKISRLEARIRELEKENEELKQRLDRARGTPAEVLVAQMTGGERTGRYKEKYDVITESGKHIEVKLSKVHHQRTTKTKRWTWDRILGPKEYDYLVLAGEKDPSCDKQYPPDLEYVFFLVPRSKVNDINSRGDCVALNTNLTNALAPKPKALISYLVHSEEEFKSL